MEKAGQAEQLVGQRDKGGRKKDAGRDLLFEPGSSCIKEEIFPVFLENELARAERYNSNVSLLVFRIAGVLSAKQVGTSLAELATFLSGRLRRTDPFGRVGGPVLGIALVNAGADDGRSALNRLKDETSLFLSAHYPNAEIKFSLAVYPTEATSLASLREKALARLAEQTHAPASD